MTSRTIHRGRLRGNEIGASIFVTACEKLGIQPDGPGVRLRRFTFVGEPRAPGTLDSWPDVDFDLVVEPVASADLG